MAAGCTTKTAGAGCPPSGCARHEGTAAAVERDPERDAWIANFYTENHLAYEAFPNDVASPEQLRFIVYVDGDPHYYPCSEATFHAIIDKKGEDRLPAAYVRVWERVEPLVRTVVEDDYRRRFLLSLLHTKFRRETASLVMLPSRLEKRLLQIFTRVSEIHRPMARTREAWNRRIHELLRSEVFQGAFNDPVGLELPEGAPLDKIHFGIQLLQLRRLMALTGRPELWEGDDAVTADALSSMMNTPVGGSGFPSLAARLREWTQPGPRRYVLWIGASAGQVMLDLAMIRLLIRMGIKVIIAVKQAFYFDAVTVADAMEDPCLQEAFCDAAMILNPRVSKKELLDALKSDRNLFVISDGTQERFNPLLCSVTFARAFKEVDAVVARSPQDAPCVLNTRFQFTRDILTLVPEGRGRVALHEKPRHPAVIRFAEADLRAKAQTLVDELRIHRQRGKTIMFYSAIVGSIPHQLETAKKVLSAFVAYLRQRQEGVYVINPAEHFEPGMDADDIMYMWEIVQRSGLINIWRFQTVDDIEKAFELSGEKIPPEWVGKDATYSTGCTKEMKIAMEVQRLHPEMQIIGPSWEKFLRRKEYGVGKFYDRALDA